MNRKYKIKYKEWDNDFNVYRYNTNHLLLALIKLIIICIKKKRDIEFIVKW